MSSINYFSNTSLVDSRDLFKILELRYSHSIFDKDGCFNAILPVSTSLELIRWYRNCEDFFDQLSLEDNKSGTLTEHHLELFQKELESLCVDQNVFEGSNIIGKSTECRRVYNEFQLSKYKDITRDKNNEIEMNEFLQDKYPVREQLKSINSKSQRFDLDDRYLWIYDELHLFLKTTELTYFLAFDIEIEAFQFNDNPSIEWTCRASILKIIFENALKSILRNQTDVLRFYVKLEDNGTYGYRFHVVIFLQSLTFSEQSWLSNFRLKLEQILINELLLREWIQPLHRKEIELFNNHSDLDGLILSAEKLNEVEQNIHTMFEQLYKPIAFQVISWNDQLRQLCPSLKFWINSLSTIQDKQLLEYWGVKYLFLSNKYIYFHEHHEKLHPSLKLFICSEPEIKNGINFYKQEGHAEASHENILTQKDLVQNSRVSGKKERPALYQRRRGDPADVFYDAKRDFTLIVNLHSISIPNQRNRFAKQKIEKMAKIDVVSSSTDQVISSSSICIFKDFVDYALNEKNDIYKVEIKNKVRISWAEIFYRNTISNAELLGFLLKFERFIDLLSHSKNPFFAVKRQQYCRPEDLSPIGGQFLELFFNFHEQKIIDKINETNIDSDFWGLISEIFDVEWDKNILQSVMHQELIQNLNDLMKKAQVVVKKYEKKKKLHWENLKYANEKLWQKAFYQERVLIRCQFNLPYVLHEHSGITDIFNKFKTRLAGDTRQFKDVSHIRLCRKKEQIEFLDVLLMFENTQGAEDECGLHLHVEELWIKVVSAEINRLSIKVSLYELGQLVNFIEFMQKYENLAVKYLYIKNCKVAREKSIISQLIPYFISQAIFLQRDSFSSTHLLSMSQNLKKLFDKVPKNK